MKWLIYFCWRNTILVKKNLVVFFGGILFPLLLFAQIGTDSLTVNKDTIPARRKTNILPIRDTDKIIIIKSAESKDQISLLADSMVSSPGLPFLKNKLFFFQRMLYNHPYFNFFGRPLQFVIQEKKGGGSEPFFYLLLLLFFYFAMIRLAFSKYLDDLFTLFFRATMRQQQLREQLLQSPLPSLFLNSLFVLSGSLYASLLLRYYKLLESTDFWLLWLYCLLLLVVVYTGKYLVLKIMGWILRINRTTDVYLFVVFMVNKMTGIFLLPVLLLMAFPDPQLLPVVITFSLFVLMFLLGYRFVISYRLIRNEIKLNLFHFFLYLCAFEIAPLLLIYKVLLNFVNRTS